MIIKKTILSIAIGLVGLCCFTGGVNALHMSADVASSFSLYSYQHSILSVSTEAEGKKARATVDEMGQKAISFLKDDSLPLSGKERKFRKLLHSNFDMGTIGRFALGRNWGVATAAQKKEYQRLFENLVVKVYSSRFNDYKGQGFDITSFRGVGKRDVMVTSYIIPATGSKVQIDWRMRNKNGQYKVVDVVIEGVSMAVTQRSDFASVIQRGGGKVEVLLSHLRK